MKRENFLKSSHEYYFYIEDTSGKYESGHNSQEKEVRRVIVDYTIIKNDIEMMKLKDSFIVIDTSFESEKDCHVRCSLCREYDRDHMLSCHDLSDFKINLGLKCTSKDQVRQFIKESLFTNCYYNDCINKKFQLYDNDE